MKQFVELKASLKTSCRHLIADYESDVITGIYVDGSSVWFQKFLLFSDSIAIIYKDNAVFQGPLPMVWYVGADEKRYQKSTAYSWTLGMK